MFKAQEIKFSGIGKNFLGLAIRNIFLFRDMENESGGTKKNNEKRASFFSFFNFRR
jgi:hypothetical protein